MGKCIASSRFLWMNIFCLSYVPLFWTFGCCIAPCLILSVITCVTYSMCSACLACTYLKSSPITCPPSSVLYKWLLHIRFNICVYPCLWLLSILYVVHMATLFLCCFLSCNAWCTIGQDSHTVLKVLSIELWNRF